jgi:Xaa-Pro dipeptidase
MSRLTQTFRDNRLELGADLRDGIILTAGSELTPRNSDVSYIFRQNSNFLFLTGVENPGYALLMNPRSKKEILFIPKVDQRHRVWEGDVPGIPEHKKRYGFSDVRFLDELPKVFKQMTRSGKPLYTDDLGSKLLKRFKISYKKNQKRYLDGLSFSRVEKNPGELALMKKANQVAGRGHVAAMKAAKPGLYEYEVQAVLEMEFLRGGMRHHAYPSIVATGKNSSCLHYTRNDAVLQNGDLLLIDAGCEYMGYAADITRTFPVSGKFTPAQRDVYQVVLSAHEACIHAVRNGVRSSEVHLLSQRMLAAGLQEIGLLKVGPEEAVETEAIRLFYPHGLGHPLGLDVHDVGGGARHQLPVKNRPKNLRSDMVLRPGMVMTVEPGIYFIKALLKDKENRSKYRQQVKFGAADKLLSLGGIRIEDDVVVVEKGPPTNLTSVPKSVEDIEATCAS